MIYIEEKDFHRQFDLLAFLVGRMQFNICAWLYPESALKKLSGFEVTNNPFQLTPVTTYGDGVLPKCTTLVQASDVSLNSFKSSSSELKKNCDSLALYKDNESSWYAVTIGHEGMCLIQDDSLLSNLIGAGFNASTEAPAWW